MLIDESEMLITLANAKRVLLVEPPYHRKWIPLGLAKISSFVKSNGGQVDFVRHPIMKKYDLICITTCFTTDSRIVLKSIRDCQRGLYTKGTKIIVGGIFASLMPKYIMAKTGVDVFVGYSPVLDSFFPDYIIDWGIDDRYKEDQVLFTVRGCPNRCAYCMVWKMEPEFYVLPNWQEQIETSSKKRVILMDNNLLATPIEHMENVVEILNRNQKTVTMNGGVDCKFVTDENAKLLSSLIYNNFGFRIAFDKMSDDGHFQIAMEKILNAGLKPKGISYCYVLFNFDDTPQEAFYRSRECWKYGVEPYLMRYKPLNMLTMNNNFVGKYWTKRLADAFQIYWQNYGYAVNDGSMEAFVENYEIHGKKNRLKLTKEDWDKWNYVRK